MKYIYICIFIYNLLCNIPIDEACQLTKYGKIEFRDSTEGIYIAELLMKKITEQDQSLDTPF